MNAKSFNLIRNHMLKETLIMIKLIIKRDKYTQKNPNKTIKIHHNLL